MPAVSLACYAVMRLVRVDHTTPVYVINLLALDLIQVLMKPLHILYELERTYHALLSSHFMFLLGQFDVLFGTRECTQSNVLSRSVLPFGLILTITLMKYFLIPPHLNLRAVLFFVLFMCVVICYAGTWRTIRSVRSIPDEEKKRIMHLLGMVVGTYGVLFLPLCFLSIYTLLNTLSVFPSILRVYLFSLPLWWILSCTFS
ncbi:uncharacterized protein LOC143133427 [Alosa pseudoharengus]|uniref:uncharacterized protein LOC143133427 n=1 Tax=Alosa pseudoharengus TaxID=34774 RepID=UPI003F8B38F2